MIKKAQITMQGFLFSLVTAFLVIGVFGWWIASSVDIYDITGYNETQLSVYSNSDNITQVIEDQGNTLRSTTVDKNLFDYFAGIFDSILTPIQTIIGTIETAYNLSSELVKTLKLPPMFVSYFITIISIFIIIGILMIKYFLGRDK